MQLNGFIESSNTWIQKKLNATTLNEDFIKTYINEYINKFNLHKYLDDVIVDNSFQLYCGYCENYDGKQVIFVDPSYVISDILRNIGE